MKQEYIDYLITMQNTLIRNGVTLPIEITDDLSTLYNSVDILEEFCCYNRFLHACNSVSKIAILSCTGKVLFSEIQKEEVLKEIESGDYDEVTDPVKETIEIAPYVSNVKCLVSDFDSSVRESMKNFYEKIQQAEETEEKYYILGEQRAKAVEEDTSYQFDDEEDTESTDEDISVDDSISEEQSEPEDTESDDVDITSDEDLEIEETDEGEEDLSADDEIVVEEVEDDEDIQVDDADTDEVEDATSDLTDETTETYLSAEELADLDMEETYISAEDLDGEETYISEEDLEDESTCIIVPNLYTFYAIPEGFELCIPYTDVTLDLDEDEFEESINDMIIYLVGVDDSSSDTEDEDLDVDEDDISSSDEESDEDDVGYDEDEGIDIQPDSDSTEDEEDAEDLDEDVSSEDAEEDSGEKSLFWKDPDESSYEDLDIDNDFDDSYTADESVEEDEDIAEDEDLTDEDSEDTSDSDGDVAFDDISADDYFADSLGSAEIRRNITSIPNNVKNTADTSNNRCFDEKVADTLTGGVAKVFDLCKTRIRKIRDQNEDKM